MRHVEAIFGGGRALGFSQQPGLFEFCQHIVDAVGGFALPQRLAGHGAAHEFVFRDRRHQFQEQPLATPLILVQQFVEGLVGDAHQRLARTADALIDRLGDAIALLVRPQLAQRELQQRQRRRLAAHFAHQLFDEALLEPQADALGRRFDDAPQLLRRERRRRETRARRHRQRAERVQFLERASLILAHADDDPVALDQHGERLREILDDRLGVAALKREQLLELIDDENDRLCVKLRDERVGFRGRRRESGRARRDLVLLGVARERQRQRPERVASWREAVEEFVCALRSRQRFPQLGREPGLQKRSLAAARGRGDDDERRRLHRLQQFHRRFLAAEKPRHIQLGKGGQPLVGRGGLRKVRREGRVERRERPRAGRARRIGVGEDERRGPIIDGRLRGLAFARAIENGARRLRAREKIADLGETRVAWRSARRGVLVLLQEVEPDLLQFGEGREGLPRRFLCHSASLSSKASGSPISTSSWH